MQQAFDTIAKDYDASFTHSIIGKAQRQIVWGYLEKTLLDNKKLNVLELNCGTGEDALRFAERGHTVLATDISEKMLTITEQKVKANNLSDLIQTKKIDLSKPEQLNLDDNFDLIFSNFGGINCLPFNDLFKLPESLFRLLKPGGRILLVIMPIFCVWEMFYFTIKLSLKKAFRRYSYDGTIAKLNGIEFRTFYYTPNHIKKIFGENFDVINIKPVGLFIPPSYLEKFFAPKVKTFNLLKKMEKIFSNKHVLGGFSDHYLIDLQVKA